MATDTVSTHTCCQHCTNALSEDLIVALTAENADLQAELATLERKYFMNEQLIARLQAENKELQRKVKDSERRNEELSDSIVVLGKEQFDVGFEAGLRLMNESEKDDDRGKW